MDFEKGGFIITTDRAKLDEKRAKEMLKRTYWAFERSDEDFQKVFDHSLVFSAFSKEGIFVGMLRVVTDYATFAYIADVIVDESARHQGCASAMLKCVFEYQPLQNIARWCLITRDAHPLYEKFGFTPLADPSLYMEISNMRYKKEEL